MVLQLSLMKSYFESVQLIKDLFSNNFQAPVDASQAENDLKELMESPLFRQYIFSNNAALIIDHYTFRYRYVSENVEDVLGVSKHELMNSGISKALEIMHPDDLIALSPVFIKATEVILSLPIGVRPYLHFCYTMRYNTPKGFLRFYQQTIPITFNDAGLPYLALALVSDITEYSREESVNYKLSLNLPGYPVKTIASGNASESASPFSQREREIVSHLADGLDTNQIADKLFISEGTVRKHRQNILEKTGAKNSVHLVRMAVANGWL